MTGRSLCLKIKFKLKIKKKIFILFAFGIVKFKYKLNKNSSFFDVNKTFEKLFLEEFLFNLYSNLTMD
ncbi:hypothetical protein BpHYR1_037988 [Brachionus plicatilis]|uniref:Uncharacterized protein n=1 Tax=Brachionus plicatilis TaxID=10195 RepID=A0A3M7SDX1_BRAPC|nr:hypothetical protein BpHYR1_037988 [Brachionus plicatilis]